MTRRLEGKRAIVTGGGAGIGRGAAIKLAQDGASVGVLDVNLTTAEETASLIAKAGGRAMALRVNVADEAQVADAVAKAEAEFGGLDTLIPNAGVMLFGRDTVATELDLATWQQCIDVNLTGMFLTCKHGLRALERNGQRRGGDHGFPHGCIGLRADIYGLQHQQGRNLWAHAHSGDRLREEKHPGECGFAGHGEFAAGHDVAGGPGEASGVSWARFRWGVRRMRARSPT